MRLRIQYGGTFDPVHNGHLAVARCARDRLDADVWLMPAADPPHKGPTQADAAQRLQMLEQAIVGQSRLHADDRELRRAGPSYTIDTLIDLRRASGPAAPLAILIGADSFLGLPTWKRWEALFEHAHIVVAQRPGSRIDPDRLPDALQAQVAPRWRTRATDLQATPAGHVLVLTLPLRPESSTQLRRDIAEGDPAWRRDVPPAVAAYIDRTGLYRTARERPA